MNMMNQIILEGKCTGEIALNKVIEWCGFWIECEVIERGGKKATHKFWVESYGLLADACQKAVKAGRVVSVVGGLRQHEKNPSEIHVLAEHIEFKPMAEKEEKDA